jgi:CRP-like cAMP-binding protein
MGLEQDIDLLSRVAMFQSFETEQLRLIAFGTERRRLKKGSVLFQQGESSDGGFVVASGQIDIVTRQGGHEATLESVTEAGLIGELSLITQNLRIASAVARIESDVLFIPRTLFHRLLQEYPQMAALLHARIAHSVRGIVSQMEAVQKKLADLPPLSDRGGEN